MNHNDIEVQGFMFSQIDVLGEYLPSRTSIESVLSEIKDIRNKRKFLQCSNSVVMILNKSFNPQYCQPELTNLDRNNYQTWVRGIVTPTLPELNKMFLLNMEIMCEISGYDFALLIRSTFIVNWYHSIVGNFSGGDIQKVRKESKTLLLIINREKNIDSLSEKQDNIDYSELEKYSDFAAANKYLYSFNKFIGEALEHDSGISIFNNEIFEIIHESAKIIEKRDKGVVVFFCKQCKTHSTVKQGNIPLLCKSCQNKKRDEKKASRRIPRFGWEFDRVGECIGGCGSDKIQINSKYICFGCHRSKHLQTGF
jgi:hypothetical protein